jgi:hypothetical protein
MNLTSYYTSVKTSRQRIATNYSATKDFARDLIYFFTQAQSVFRRAETDTRHFLNNFKPEKD